MSNLLQEIEGKLPQDKERMLAIINRFQELSAEERANFKVGRRAGIYSQLDDLYDLRKHEVVDQLVYQLTQGGNEVDDKTIYALMERFI